MFKKLCYGAAALLMVAILSAAITSLTFEAREAHAKTSSAPAWTDHPDASRIQQPQLLTKHQLFSEDHTADVVAVQQVWAAYTFYNDSHNGPGLASLFTPDGVDQHLWDDGHGVLIPHFGIVAPGDEGKNMTPEGPKGSGCVLHGRAQIAFYFMYGQPNPIAWPGHSHHETPSILVKVADDGQTAVMSAPYVIAGVNAKGEGHIGTGGYRAFYKKTSEGWEIAELYAIDDRPAITPRCTVDGPIGMPK